MRYYYSGVTREFMNTTNKPHTDVYTPPLKRHIYESCGIVFERNSFKKNYSRDLKHC